MRLKTLLSMGLFFLVFSFFALGALDLKFTGKISMTPNPAAAGDPVSFSVNFNNEGSGVDNLFCIGGVDGVRIFERTFAHIDAGKNRTLAFNWAATGGSHTVWFELDPDHLQKDENYGNNRIEITIKIGGETEPAEKLPDLVVPDAWASPATVEPRSNITFGCDIQNKGGAIKGKWMARFLVDNEEVLSKEFNDFPAGGYQLYKQEIIADDIGSHILTCQADPKNTIIESNESNNSWTSSFKVVEKAVKLPDLKIKKIWVEPAQIQIGDWFSLNCAYEYDQGTSNKPFSIWIVLPTVGPALGRGWDTTDFQTRTYSVKWQATHPGRFTFSCDVDRENQIAESDEKNNAKSSEFTVSPNTHTPKQDMYFSDIRTKAVNEKTFSLCCDIGSKNFAQPFIYDYILDGQTIHSQESTNGFGGCHYYDLNKLTPGTHTLECVIDPQNKIPETDENNNRGSRTFVVEKKQPLPDLLAESVSTDKKKYSEGEEVQVICFYKNIGGPFEGKWRLMVFVGGDKEYSNNVVNTSGYVPWTWKAKGSGKYNVGCSLDTQQQVTESNESNNMIKDTIEVVPLKGVILFEHDNYNGAQETFMADDPDLRNNVIGNDKASSIKVPAGCVATLYEHINYQGKSETFRGNDNWLGDNTIGNDSVSSIKVKCGK
jgi:hypothetical protein